MGIIKSSTDSVYKLADFIGKETGISKVVNSLFDIFKTSFTFKGGMFDKNKDKGDALLKRMHAENMSLRKEMIELQNEILNELTND